MPAAAERVFSIPELLESILLKLPQRDILVLQRINTSFKATIQHSSHVQGNLFLQQPLDNRNGASYLNPLILPALRSHGFDGDVYVATPGNRYPDLIHEELDYRVSRCRSSKIPLEEGEVLKVKINFFKISFIPSGKSYEAMLVSNSPIVFYLYTGLDGTGQPRKKRLWSQRSTILLGLVRDTSGSTMRGSGAGRIMRKTRGYRSCTPVE